nr:MAG TPA: hypothetical protein [Caudoviricetes sp.]
MISLNKLAEAIMEKFKKIESRKMVQERVNFSTTWTAPHDGIIIRGGRAQYNTAYMFCNDKTDDVYVGMCTIEISQHYGTMICAVIAGHTYEFKQQSWQIQGDLFVYEK